MEKIEARLAEVGVEKLKEMVHLAFDDCRDGADIVFSAILKRLESLMPESEYVEFLDSLL